MTCYGFVTVGIGRGSTTAAPIVIVSLSLVHSIVILLDVITTSGRKCRESAVLTVVLCVVGRHQSRAGLRNDGAGLR